MKEEALRIIKEGRFTATILIGVIYALLYIGDAIVSLKEK
jgi:hypothetical protein